MEINAKGMHFAELDRLVKDSAAPRARTVNTSP